MTKLRAFWESLFVLIIFFYLHNFINKKSRLYDITNKLCYRDEISSRGTTLVPAINKLADAFIDSALSGFSDYPMITEEAGLPLMQKPPTPPWRGKSGPTPGLHQGPD